MKINKNLFKPYTKKELKTLDDGKVYGKLSNLERRVWVKETNKLNEENITYFISLGELETIIKEAKQRFKYINKSRAKRLRMILSHITPELTFVVLEGKDGHPFRKTKKGKQ